MFEQSQSSLQTGVEFESSRAEYGDEAALVAQNRAKSAAEQMYIDQHFLKLEKAEGQRRLQEIAQISLLVTGFRAYELAGGSVANSEVVKNG